MKKFLSFSTIFLSLTLILVLPMIFCGCKKQNIKVYNTIAKQIETMPLETYIERVVAGEIDNDSPLEALKAQAVLARTFALKFMSESKSKYEGADISTDILECQAYNVERVNENIKKAVKETKGKTIKYNGDYINAFFHSNSGGQTASAKEGLNLDGDYEYLKVVKTKENSENSKNYEFKAVFSKNEILNALRNIGASVSNISSFKIGEKGESGRCITFIIGGKEVNANTFRLAIGSTKLKSTLISDISVSDTSVTFTGKGYGHGVGLSQEYAIVLAKEGKNYKQILDYFFKDIEVK